jgi:hypothetical protein
VLPLLALAAACAEDPQYLRPEAGIEVSGDDQAAPPLTQFILPIRPEKEEEATARAERAAALGIEVPFVRRDDLGLSIEWTVSNPGDQPGTARIHINAGNEWYRYVPANFVVDPEEDEEPPPLLGGVPIEVPAGRAVSGVFREDQLAEAALDLELMSRGTTNPFAAILQVDEETRAFADPAGLEIPAEAFAALVLFDIELRAEQPMALRFAVRVRDRRDLLHDQRLAAAADELTTFAPVEFGPAAAPPMP